MWRNLVLLLLSASLAACAIVSTGPLGIGGGVKPIPETENQYSFKLFWNAFATSDDVQNKAKEVIKEFMEKNNYEDFEILNVKRVTKTTTLEGPHVKYTIKLYRNRQDRKLTKFKTKQEGGSRGPVDFTDDNPEFVEHARHNPRLTLIIDFTVSHFNASARSGADAIIDVTESRETAHTLAKEFSKKLEAAGYEIKKTIYSSGWSVKPIPVRVRHSPADRKLPVSDLSRESPPFYLDDLSREERGSLESIYRRMEPSVDNIFTEAALLAKKYDSDALFIVLGYAQIPTKGREITGLLDTLSMSSTHNARVWLSHSVLKVGTQIIDAETGKQFGFAGREKRPDNPIAAEPLIAVTDELLKDYPKR